VLVNSVTPQPYRPAQLAVPWLPAGIAVSFRAVETLEHTRESRLSVALGTEAAAVLIHWATSFRPGEGGGFDSYALRTRDGWVLIDPVLPDAAVLERLEGLLVERPVATVLTSDGHERDARAFRDRWGTPIWGPIPVESERGIGYDGEPDHMYEEGSPTELPGGLRAVRVAGLWGGDHVLRWRAPTGERVLFTGDPVNGQVQLDLAAPDHFRRANALNFGARPGYAERHPERGALRRSLSRLLEEDFDLLCGSHATPFRDNAKAALAALLATI
jgi:hypothetical protein